MCEIGNKQATIVTQLCGPTGEVVINPEWFDYALLVLATDTPIDRAITYLKDTGSPEKASGRLLLRAAEKALRAAGDVD